MKILLLVFLALSIQIASAELTFSTDQSEYYTLIGEKFTLPIQVVNTYGIPISGNLEYTVTQNVNQGGVQFANKNTNTSPLTLSDENQTIAFDLGTVNTPTTLTLDLEYSYFEMEDKIVKFGPIDVHFVQDDSQQNNQQDPTQSSSQSPPQPTQEEQNQQAQNAQDRLQNNQLDQDSSALKQEIQQQIQQEDQQRQEFGDNLAEDENFMEQHDQLVQDGYEITQSNADTSSADTGEFDIEYQNQEGKWARLSGQMNNGTVDSIQQQRQEFQEQMLEQLQENEEFQEFAQSLEQEGFTENSTSFEYDQNMTQLDVEYQGNNDTAKISAIFENNTLVSVEVQKESDEDLFYLVYIISFVIAGVLAYILYRRFSKKEMIPVLSPVVQSAPFDYIAESRKLVAAAQRHYDNKQYRDAFGMAGQAIRLYLSHDSKIGKEMTNEEIMRHIQTSKYPVDDIRKSLEVTSLVEFAKSQHTQEAWDEINELFSLWKIS